MQTPADIEGSFHLLGKGGRLGAVRSGYRPAHKIFDNYFSSGRHEYVGIDELPLGATAHAYVWLLTPEVYPQSLWVGRVIGVYEGSKLVGQLKISAIHNPVLLGQPESYNPTWVMPPGLNAQT
jgi:hypothetical protein